MTEVWDFQVCKSGQYTETILIAVLCFLHFLMVPCFESMDILFNIKPYLFGFQLTNFLSFVSRQE